MHKQFDSRHAFVSFVAGVVLASCGGAGAVPGIGADGGAGRITIATGGRGAPVVTGAGGSVVGGSGSGACQAAANDCTSNAQCCSGRCEPVTGQAGMVQCTIDPGRLLIVITRQNAAGTQGNEYPSTVMTAVIE